ncbi:MAG: aminotransferase class V-fold PLP-dependent enzyme [Krumholzibacteria bacterium]|nr:aminotransferase class V-fold PLP-dependent enzyme [Candidatus Krumholzibacteria bacterium]
MGAKRPVYLDFCATTPVEPEVADLVMRYMVEDFGNAGSRTHEMGTDAKRALEHARRQVAAAISFEPAEIHFTSGATESNNLALLGLAEYGRDAGKNHIITTAIEHKSVLEPCRFLESQGFSITFVPPASSGAISASAVMDAIRDNTLLATIIHANNETGAVQPIRELIGQLHDRNVLVHTDAAQSFCKLPGQQFLRDADLVSVSGHKIGAPKGIGALAVNRRRQVHLKIRPIMHGGGQEAGLRPGTIPVAAVAGLGLASEIKAARVEATFRKCHEVRDQLVALVEGLGFSIVGSGEALPNCICVDFSPIDAEAIFVALRGRYCVSNGSACTSASRSRSHVLVAMKVHNDSIDSSIRISWDHRVNLDNLTQMIEEIALLR